MSVTTTRYVRKPLYVDAVRITRGNFEDIAEWCNGEILQDEVPGKGTGKKYLKVEVHNPRDARQTKAYVGDWLLLTERGFKIYTNKSFVESFDENDGDTPVRYPYPFNEGDVTVIGPECFATKDGSVLCWQGVNYVQQAINEKAA